LRDGKDTGTTKKLWVTLVASMVPSREGLQAALEAAFLLGLDYQQVSFP